VGAAPLRALFEALVGPAAWPRTPGVRCGRYRTVSCDGCKTIKVPGTVRNRGWLGKMRAVNGETGCYPVIALMTLVETGTRALLGAVFGGTAVSELGWARQLLHRLDATMLVLLDRGLDAGTFLAELAATRGPVPGPADRENGDALDGRGPAITFARSRTRRRRPMSR
jgi:hypothetical protein